VEKAILLKSYEKESLLKNFLVFFSLLIILLVALFLELYHTNKREYKQNLYKSMQICSYTLKCEEYGVDFATRDVQHYNQLYENNSSLTSYFGIPNSEKFDLMLSYPMHMYIDDIKEIKTNLWVKFILASLILLIIALFFTFYSLNPIRKALNLNDEFIKDILHDFNTPITSMVLNMKMYEEEKGESPFLSRISSSIDNILLLQNNLKCFLQHSPSQNYIVDIAELLHKRVEFMQSIYPRILFSYEKNNDLLCLANEEMLTRIFDNILSNAAKYNTTKGKVIVSISGNIVCIEDTGKGIKNVSKVMQRYYKEQDRGLGLGLHIVKKLVHELNIVLTVDSEVNVGTKFLLDFKHLRKEAV